MDNLGDIVYLLVLVLFAITGIMGKKNKAKSKPTQTESGEPAEPNPWEELERHWRKREAASTANRTKEIRVEPEWETYRSKAHTHTSEPVVLIQTYEPTEMEQPISYDTEDDVSKLRVKKQVKESVKRSSTSIKTSMTHAQADDTVAGAFEVSFDDVEDAKRAFVYAEVFNRKYS